MIDVSDGLCSDLLQIAHQSHLAAEVEVDHLPLPEQDVGEIDLLEAALNGGEDYALLLTTSEKQLDRLNSTYRTDFPPYRVIGRLFHGEPGVYLKRGKKRERYEPRGFDHFSSC